MTPSVVVFDIGAVLVEWDPHLAWLDEMGSEDIKDFNAFASGMKPRYTMEKPVTPKKLVEAISDILDVTIEEALAPDDDGRMAVMKMVSETDEGTLKKIQELLAK